MNSFIRVLSLIFFISVGNRLIFACESTVRIKLENNNGGFYAGQWVKLTGISDVSSFTQQSDKLGEVVFLLPCNTRYKVEIGNYTRKFEVSSPDQGGTSNQSLNYSPDMLAKTKLFAMNESEMAEVDKTAMSLPDTSSLKDVLALAKNKPQHFVRFIFTVEDLSSKPLVDELVVLTGVKRNKSFKGKTNAAGRMMLYLPKGDTYQVSFILNKNYAFEECVYSKGISESEMGLSYLGTKELLRRKKIEEDRIIAEEKRLKAEEAIFKAWCKKLKISEAEGHKRKLMEDISTPDTVINTVMNRNHWTQKLIVCDLTGSMSPYTTQLSLWYQLNYKVEKNLQFVFFNDGDGKLDDQKVIGNTGGIYYTPSKGLDSLRNFIAMVSSKGGGGDCPENNMEALIKGTQMAAPFKELVMIVDNYAPVKDIELLKLFNIPVHIILCGASSGNILTDYLDIARKTGGTVHTIEEDITGLAKLSEGQELNIGGIRYRIMGGKFVLVNKA